MLRCQREGLLLVTRVLVLLRRRLLPRCRGRHRDLNMLRGGVLPIRRGGVLWGGCLLLLLRLTLLGGCHAWGLVYQLLL